MSEKEITEIGRVEAGDGSFDRSWRDEQWDGRALSVAAQEISMEEKDMSIWQAIQANKAAICWSLVISTCVIMEGYDTNLLGNFYAYRELRTLLRPCGDPYLQTFKQLSKRNTAAPFQKLLKHQAAFLLAPAGNLAWARVVVSFFIDFKWASLTPEQGCGSILGTIINGWLVTAFGPRKVVLCTLCVMSCFLFIVFFAPNKQVLLVGEILLGFEWGIVC